MHENNNKLIKVNTWKEISKCKDSDQGFVCQWNKRIFKQMLLLEFFFRIQVPLEEKECSVQLGENNKEPF